MGHYLSSDGFDPQGSRTLEPRRTRGRRRRRRHPVQVCNVLVGTLSGPEREGDLTKPTERMESIEPASPTKSSPLPEARLENQRGPETERRGLLLPAEEMHARLSEGTAALAE